MNVPKSIDFKRLAARMALIVWVLAWMAYVLQGQAPFHGDESTLVLMSRDYAYQFLERDMAKVLYQQPPWNSTEQELRLLNGTISKYSIGLVWHVGGYTLAQLPDQYDWGADWDYNVATARVPDAALLAVIRAPSTIMTALGVAVMAALGWWVGGWRAAMLACALYALNPPLLLNGRRAMFEGAFLLFTLLTVLAGVALAAHLQRPQTNMARHMGARRWVIVSLFVALGISGGMALASKHTAVVAVGAVFGGVAWALVRADWRRWPFLALSAMLCLAVFFLLNPAWWNDPLGRAAEVLTMRNQMLSGQAATFGGYADWGERMAGLLRQTLLQPMYYEVDAWGTYPAIAEQIRAYEASAWGGLALSPWIAAAGGVLALWGVWRLARDGAAGLVVLLWAGATIAFVVLATPLEWQRYYLPMYPPLIVLIARAVGPRRPFRALEA
jgi:4-amino-4-deoxy-L-arabinose transferase-like glycosyltransferase